MIRHLTSEKQDDENTKNTGMPIMFAKVSRK